MRKFLWFSRMLLICCIHVWHMDGLDEWRTKRSVPPVDDLDVRVNLQGSLSELSSRPNQLTCKNETQAFFKSIQVITFEILRGELSWKMTRHAIYCCISLLTCRHCFTHTALLCMKLSNWLLFSIHFMHPTYYINKVILVKMIALTFQLLKHTKGKKHLFSFFFFLPWCCSWTDNPE